MEKKERYIDLHLHTKCSDGERTVEETIADAIRADLSAIAITDHNCFGIMTPMQTDNLEVIPGAEFGTSYHYGEGKKREVHMVGLFFDGVDPAMNRIFERIDKHAYIQAIIDQLSSLGIPVTMEEVEARQKYSGKLGRHQVAEVLIEKGFAPDMNLAMDLWVGNFSPYYVNSLDYIQYISMEDCVHEILYHNGLPILAHPLHYQLSRPEVEELVFRYRNITDKPLAMEVYYGKYKDSEIEYLEKLADKYNLLPSASSDRHRAAQPFARGGYVLLENMKKAMGKK